MTVQRSSPRVRLDKSPQTAEQGAFAPARIGIVQLGMPVVLDVDAMGQSELDTVNSQTAVAPSAGATIVSPQGETNDLAQFFVEYPNAIVQQLSPAIVGVWLTAANPAQDIALPDGTTVFSVWGKDDYWLAPTGKALVPALANFANLAQIFKPNGQLWYGGGKKAVSVASAVDGTYVSVMCYITNKRPTVDGA